jgi:hypothetical protein
MEDRQGNDWISFQPGGGPAGEYRGIPNLVYPEGHFHPGKLSSRSSIVIAGPVKASIFSETIDGKWQGRWDIYPNFARMTVLKADHPYWFLYEGTPGGSFDTTRDYWARSDGQSGPTSEKWWTKLPGPAWITFNKPGTSTDSIYLARNESDDTINSFWPMQEEMTVFGYGRNDEGGPQGYLTAVPAQFTIGFAPSHYPETQTIVDGVRRELHVTVGAPKAVAWE